MRKLILKTAYLLFGKSIAKKYNFIYSPCAVPSSPFILLCNHLTDHDGSFAAIAFSSYYMNFVMSEHVIRRPVVGKLIKLLLNPVVRQKGKSDYIVVKSILGRIRKNENVCLFPEGNRSPDGRSLPIPASTAKLIKLSGATLVTYRFSGGYFTQPRWAKYSRRGKVCGEMVSCLSPQQLKLMSAEQLSEVIKKDLYVDDYLIQQNEKTEFLGKALAEKLETVIYMCPACGEISTIKTCGDKGECSCGLSFIYTKEGYFESIGEKVLPFTTVREWFEWQENALHEKCALLGADDCNEFVIFDEHQCLKRIDSGVRSIKVISGTLEMSFNRFSFRNDAGKEFSFKIKEIEAMEICDMDRLVFSCVGRESYEVVSKKGCFKNAYKYLALYNIIKSTSTGE